MDSKGDFSQVWTCISTWAKNICSKLTWSEGKTWPFSKKDFLHLVFTNFVWIFLFQSLLLSLLKIVPTPVLLNEQMFISSFGHEPKNIRSLYFPLFMNSVFFYLWNLQVIISWKKSFHLLKNKYKHQLII